MKSLPRVLLYGFVIWLVVFAVAMVIYPLRVANRALFESIMPVALSLAVVLAAVIYLRPVRADFWKEGVRLGLTWLGVNLAMDLLVFMWGPMRMTLADYLADIGLTYLVIPVFALGAGYLVQIHQRQPGPEPSRGSAA